MHYSFIKPRPKSIITPDLRLVLIFFSITLAMLITTYLFLSYKSYDFGQKQLEYAGRIYDLNRTLASYENEIAAITQQQRQAEQIYTTNTVLKESIRNLFDLVPDRITLTRATLEKHALILYGITPNKDVYEFMLWKMAGIVLFQPTTLMRKSCENSTFASNTLYVGTFTAVVSTGVTVCIWIADSYGKSISCGSHCYEKRAGRIAAV